MYLRRAYKHQWMQVIPEEPIYKSLKSTNLGYSFLFSNTELILPNTQDAYSLLPTFFRIDLISPKAEVVKKRK